MATAPRLTCAPTRARALVALMACLVTSSSAGCSLGSEYTYGEPEPHVTTELPPDTSHLVHDASATIDGQTQALIDAELATIDAIAAQGRFLDYPERVFTPTEKMHTLANARWALTRECMNERGYQYWAPQLDDQTQVSLYMRVRSSARSRTPEQARGGFDLGKSLDGGQTFAGNMTPPSGFEDSQRGSDNKPLKRIGSRGYEDTLMGTIDVDIDAMERLGTTAFDQVELTTADTPGIGCEDLARLQLGFVLRAGATTYSHHESTLSEHFLEIFEGSPEIRDVRSQWSGCMQDKGIDNASIYDPLGNADDLLTDGQISRQEFDDYNVRASVADAECIDKTDAVTRWNAVARQAYEHAMAAEPKRFAAMIPQRNDVLKNSEAIASTADSTAP